MRAALTDPEQVPDFVRRTGAACLAVSIGNVHGRYRETPQLGWERLEAIRARAPVPLSLHGGAGGLTMIGLGVGVAVSGHRAG